MPDQAKHVLQLPRYINSVATKMAIQPWPIAIGTDNKGDIAPTIREDSGQNCSSLRPNAKTMVAR